MDEQGWSSIRPYIFVCQVSWLHSKSGLETALYFRTFMLYYVESTVYSEDVKSWAKKKNPKECRPFDYLTFCARTFAFHTNLIFPA